MHVGLRVQTALYVSFGGGMSDPGCKQQRAHLVAGIDIVYNPQRRVLLASTV